VSVQPTVLLYWIGYKHRMALKIIFLYTDLYIIRFLRDLKVAIYRIIFRYLK